MDNVDIPNYKFRLTLFVLKVNAQALMSL